MSASSVYLLYIQLEMVGGLAVQYSLLTLKGQICGPHPQAMLLATIVRGE
jgi:hypothetical protein